MRGSRPAFPVKPIVFLVAACALSAALFYSGRRLSRLDLFKVKQIVSRAENPPDLSYLEGENIFGIDLKKEAARLQLSYPGYSRIRLVKVFPDRIFVDLKERRPLAYVKLFRYFCVDESMVLFDPPAQQKELPIILGLEARVYRPSAGSKVSLKELDFAVSLIKSASREPVLRGHPIKTIKVPSLSNASFSIAEGLEVRISQEGMEGKLDILNSLLAQEKERLMNIKYIDLRFKEPVIKLKNAD